MPHDTELDPYQILADLHIGDVGRVTRALGGADTSIWRVEHGHMVSALRVFEAGRARSAAREHVAMTIAGRGGIAVPEVRLACEWQGRPVLLLSWCSGQTLGAVLLAAPWRLLPLARTFGVMQARIHGLEAPELYAPGASWIEWQQAADPALAARLRQLAPPQPRLLHLDYHPLNVLVDGGHVSAVLDWANAAAGDPRADVARTYTILRVEPQRPGREPLWLAGARSVLARAWLAGYRSVAGPLGDMAPFFAWAGAVMAADLAPRVADPASWWQARHLERIQAWTQRWRAQI